MSKSAKHKIKPNLKSCPFCGSPILDLWDNEEEVNLERQSHHSIDYEAGITCQTCGAEVTFNYGNAYPYDANEAREWTAYLWNKRE